MQTYKRSTNCGLQFLFSKVLDVFPYQYIVMIITLCNSCIATHYMDMPECF